MVRIVFILANVKYESRYLQYEIKEKNEPISNKKSNKFKHKIFQWIFVIQKELQLAC